MIKKTNRIRKIFHSVFTKLLMVIFVTGFLINMIVIGFFWKETVVKSRIPVGRNLAQYANYLIDDIGYPPSFERAKEISQRLYFNIRFTGPESGWSTSTQPLPINRKKAKIIYTDSNVQVEHYRNWNSAIVQKEYGQFVFSTSRGFNPEDEIRNQHIGLILILSACFIAAFFVIRRLLKPLKDLSEGVREVSTGNLEHKVPQKRSDELGELAEAFNDMTDRISEMLHAREQLLLDVSHELRTPLTRMKVALEFFPDSKAKQNISDDVSEIEKMITEKLETARLRNVGTNLNKKQVNLADLIRETALLFDEQPPGVELSDVASDIQAVLDPDLIRTVLKNIFTNAVKYSDKEGAPVRVLLKKRTGEVVVEIHDKGIGIASEDLPHIFEPFYRADKSRSKKSGGYGLGLSLCKTIMEAHNGRIEVESVEGEGTTIFLIFPVANNG